MIRIGLDMMGGDFAPVETAKGLLHYIEKSHTPVVVLAIGDQLALGNLIPGHISEKIQIVPAASVIGMHEHPARAFKEKTDSSIAIGFQLLKEGKIDAFISAGNTGAMLVGTHFSIKPIPGILRPAIGAVFPRLNGSTGILCDVGLNADCKPENLEQFARLSNIFAKEILQIENPKVGLLNIGEEEGKGNLLAQESYKILKADTSIQFIGNIEGRDIFTNKADVMVCDGFTGNIVLKMYERAKERNLEDDFLNKCSFDT
jgi:glycerol-3-phosphate acyltransferase PlsX